MSERDQPTIDAANELLRTTMTAAIYLPLADGKSAYLGGDSDIALMLADKDQSGAAVRVEAVAALVPKFAGQFDTFQEWVNKAQSRLASPEHRRAICVDAKGRRMTCGADFMKARDDGDFPVRYFWECELAPAAQWACHDCGNSQQFDHRGCIKPVSARAADAPSEPSDPTDLSHRLRETADRQPGWKQLLNAAADEIERYYGGMLAWKKTAEKKDADYNNERMDRINERCKSRAADALDSQPRPKPWNERMGVVHGIEVDLSKAATYMQQELAEWRALDSQPTEPDGCAECRHTYCMSGEVCKACGDVAMQGWKGGRQPTDGGVQS